MNKIWSLQAPVGAAYNPFGSLTQAANGRCLVTRFIVSCESCGLSWMVARSFSIYEQQTIESSPCPQCGAYTLCCYRLDTFQKAQGPHRRAEQPPSSRHR
jgi:hypothetical protein